MSHEIARVLVSDPGAFGGGRLGQNLYGHEAPYLHPLAGLVSVYRHFTAVARA
jgi:hypothetical protein